MDQARARPRQPVIIPTLSLTSTGAKNNNNNKLDHAAADSFQDSPASSSSHAGGQDSTDSEAFLQPRNAAAHRRHLSSPDLPKLSPTWNSSTPSSSDTTRRSDHSSWYSYPNSFPSLSNPFGQPWNGEPHFDEPNEPTGKPMQTQTQPQYFLPVMSPTAGLTHAAAPPTVGGGLGAAFPEYLPYAYNPFSSISENTQSASTEQHFPQPSRETERGQVGPSEYNQALDIYRHIRAALPYIRAADAPGPTAMGQPYRSILDVASTAVGVLSGIPPKPTAPPPTVTGKTSRAPAGAAEPGPGPKRARVSNGGDKEKPATFCRGCGATETPEWRRGPLGPRTLCNACGLVHMKMMRKKKKAEEKAAAEAVGSAPVTAV